MLAAELKSIRADMRQSRTLALIEISDVVFALDSIPATFGFDDSTSQYSSGACAPAP